MIAFLKDNVQEILGKFSSVSEYVQVNFLGKEVEEDEEPFPEDLDQSLDDLPLTLNKDPGPGIQNPMLH